MNDRYRLVVFSDVLERDGLGLELQDLSGRSLAEIFRDDTTGERTLRLFEPIPVEVADWLLGRAKEQL